jgi:hypothetical protein
MAKRRHPEIEGYESHQLYTFELKNHRKKRRDRLMWIVSGMLLGIGIGIASPLAWPYVARHISQSPRQQQTVLTEFQQGTEKAMRAAEETQRAEFREDWITVAMLWQGAIAHMESVPSSDPNHELAYQKIEEYERNLQYAQSNVETRESIQPDITSYWTLGSDRGTVISLQGTPSRVMRYDALCQEVMYFGSSRVELLNGQVSSYDNNDGNLKVLLTDPASSLITWGDRNFWTIGSSREDVFRIEGPPTRISDYESMNRETLHYGNNYVDIENGRVVGYQNRDRTFQVALAGTRPQFQAESEVSAISNQQPFWSLGSSRDELLKIQQDTPTYVSRNNNSCTEKISYGSSSVELRHGVVTGYDNLGNNLRVR